jgi:hypothetical protein
LLAAATRRFPDLPAMVRRMARTVTYAHRSKRAPRKKLKAAPLTIPRQGTD